VGVTVAGGGIGRQPTTLPPFGDRELIPILKRKGRKGCRHGFGADRRRTVKVGEREFLSLAEFLSLLETSPTMRADAAAPPAPKQTKHEVHPTPGQTTVGK